MTDFTKEPFKGNHRGFARQRIERLLDGSGIVFNGTNPWDIQVHNSAFYRRVLINGSLGFGESYMDKWDYEQIDEAMNLILRTSLGEGQHFLG